MKTIIILRIVTSPLMLAILILTYNLHCLEHFIHYLRCGGETITYNKNEDKAIADIYDKLVKMDKKGGLGAKAFSCMEKES